MRKWMILILPSIFILSHTAQAKNIKVEKNKAASYQCAVYKKNAKKAKHIYNAIRKKAKKMDKQLASLTKDQKRMPANVKTAKKLLDNQIAKLKVTKNKKLAKSMKYLEKHFQYKQAAKTCAQNRVKQRSRRFKGQDIKQYLSIASN